jgi:nucleoid DNA-binding protein
MEKYIKEYLLQHKKLQINNFGIFEVVYMPSEIHPILHTLTVPGNYVIFTENKNTYSDEFIAFVASQEKIPENEANKRINEWIDKLRETIERKEDYTLLTLGKFFINAMGKIEFAPSLDTDISPESFGLEDFTVEIPAISKKEIKPEIIEKKEVQKEEIKEIPLATTEIEKSEKEENSNDETEEIEDGFSNKKPKKRRKPVLVLLVTLLILVFCSALLIGVTYYFYPQTMQNHFGALYVFIQDKTNTLDDSKKNPEVEEIITITEISTSDEDIVIMEDQYIQPELGYAEEISGEEETETIKSIESTESITESKPVAEKQNVVKSGSYYVVIGSFKENANAETFFAKKQSEYSNVVNLGLGKTSQLYMIGIGPYSQEEAQQQIKNGVKGWLLKK